MPARRGRAMRTWANRQKRFQESSEQSKASSSQQRRRKVLSRVAATIVGVATVVATIVAIEPWAREKVGPKLIVTAKYIAADGCSGWVIPSSAEELGDVPPLGEARDEWARKRGGVDAESSRVEVTVEGTSAQAVILEGVTIEVLERRDPIAGTYVDEACGDPLGVRYLIYDIDQTPAALVKRGDQRIEVLSDEAEEELIDFPYRVTESTPERLMVITSTKNCYCEWRAVLHWEVQGEKGETVILDDGEPFRVSATAAAARYGNINGGPLQPNG